MPYIQNGQTINVSPPIKRVSVNQFKVIFFDSVGHNSIQLNNSMETRQFIHWLFAETGTVE